MFISNHIPALFKMASQRIGVIMNVAIAAFAIFNHFVSKPVSYFTIIIIMYIAFE